MSSPDGLPGPILVAEDITNPYDARLLAAAPDLRDALKDLLEVSRGLLHTASQSDIRVPSGEPEEFQQAEDALDRVES